MQIVIWVLSKNSKILRIEIVIIMMLMEIQCSIIDMFESYICNCDSQS